ARSIATTSEWVAIPSNSAAARACSDGSATATTRTASHPDRARRCVRPIRPAPISPRRNSVMVKSLTSINVGRERVMRIGDGPLLDQRVADPQQHRAEENADQPECDRAAQHTKDRKD